MAENISAIVMSRHKNIKKIIEKGRNIIGTKVRSGYRGELK
jgi:hypothetical protein